MASALFSSRRSSCCPSAAQAANRNKTITFCGNQQHTSPVGGNKGFGEKDVNSGLRASCGKAGEHPAAVRDSAGCAKMRPPQIPEPEFSKRNKTARR